MNKIITFLTAALLLSGISSCVKDNFDNPPYGGKDPNVVVNFSVDSVKGRFVSSGVNYQFTEDKTIVGIVTADDKSGNFYKQIVVQDSTGGIVLLLDGSSIYTSYPIGRRIAIKLKGLWVVQYKNLIQIAGSIAEDGSFNGIPSSLYDKFIIKGSYFHEVAPDTVSITQLNTSSLYYQNRLILIKNIEYQLSDAGKPFADGYNKFSLSRSIKDCSGHTLATYNSGFANFAYELTPSGNGSITCIYSVYSTSAQLLLRDPAMDLHLDSARCGGGGVLAGPGIANLRALFATGTTTIPSNTFITGVVISDLVGANTSSKSIILQDSLSGANIYFPAGHSYPLNEKLKINVSGLTMQVYPVGTGSFEISGATTANVTDLGIGSITPRIATAAQLNTNFSIWESTLVTVTGATLSAGTGGTYSGTTNVTDLSGSIPMYTKSTASFAGTSYPTGTVSVTGIVTTYSSAAQLGLRNAADVQ